MLHQRLREEQGLTASWGVFYRYVAKHWPDRLQHAPRVTIRRDDPPAGEEAQVDFFYVGLWDDPETGRRRKLYAFLLTLSHSRHQFLYPTPAEDSAAWLDGPCGGVRLPGRGRPRAWSLDNLTAGITHADRYDPRVNRAYGELARHYGFLVDPTRVAHPKDKPRVERNVQYARDSCFAGRTSGTLAALRAEAARWCRGGGGAATARDDGRAPGSSPSRQREAAALRPLPPQPWELAAWTSALVGPDCHLRAREGGLLGALQARQPAPGGAARGADGADLRRRDARDDPCPRRRRGASPGSTTIPRPAGPSSTAPRRRACGGRRRSGPATARSSPRCSTEPTLTRLREVQALLRLTERYPLERLERACARATTAGDGRYRTVRGILERDLDSVPLEPGAAGQATGAFLRGPAAFAVAADDAQAVAGC